MNEWSCSGEMSRRKQLKPRALKRKSFVIEVFVIPGCMLVLSCYHWLQSLMMGSSSVIDMTGAIISIFTFEVIRSFVYFISVEGWISYDIQYLILVISIHRFISVCVCVCLCVSRPTVCATVYIYIYIYI